MLRRVEAEVESPTASDPENDLEKQPLFMEAMKPICTFSRRVLPKRWHSEHAKKPAPLRLETPLSMATDDSSIPNYSYLQHTLEPPLAGGGEVGEEGEDITASVSPWK